MDRMEELAKKHRENLEKRGKAKAVKKQHLTFTSNGLFDDFNTFIFMLQSEYNIQIDDTIIEDLWEAFIYHINLLYPNVLNLKIFKNSHNCVYRLDILGVWYMKQVIYFESYSYYENMNNLIEELENNNIKILDIIIGTRLLKAGSKVTHSLIVDSINKLKVDIHQENSIGDIQRIVININGGGVIEVWKSI